MWAKPARFRRVCPLLVETPDGLRCSVDAPDVRPFWMRAVAFATGGAAGVYLVGSLLLFGILRTVGYPVTYAMVAWPPAWSEIDQARSEYFFREGADAVAAGNIKEALFNLRLAHDLSPRNYQAGLTLASLWQMAQPALSDQLYERLLLEHFDRAAQTADAWHRALLARGDYQTIKRLAARQFVRADEQFAGYWLNALFFASRQTRDDSPLREILTVAEKLPAQWRAAIETELSIHTGRTADAIIAARSIWAKSTHPFIPYYCASTLIRIGDAKSAVELLEIGAARFGDNERYRLRLDAFAVLGWKSVHEADVELLLTLPPTAPIVELLATHLVKYPNQHVLDRLFARLQDAPLPLVREAHSAYMALFCAAGVGRDFAKMDAVIETLKELSGSSLLTITSFADFFRDAAPQQRVETFLPTVPLPLDLTYAMLARYPPRLSPASGK